MTRGVAASAALAAIALVGSPFFGWFPLVRLPALLLPVLIVAFVMARPWRWSSRDIDTLAAWTPEPRTVWIATLVTGAVLAWIVLTRFRSGDINAVDFTVYFDRPLYQTAHGRLMFVETADLPDFSHRSQFAVHAYYILPILAPLYRIAATPFWLLALSVVAVVLGALHTFRIVRQLSGVGLVAAAAAFAFVLNANTARTLLYGFHPEVLYAWLIPAAIDAAIHRRRWWFLAAVIAAAAVKEDAILPLVAMAVTLALAVPVAREEWWLYLAAPPAIAAANLAAYYAWVLPIFASSSNPVYAAFWIDYGPTPARAVIGMLSRPLDVARSVATSGILRVLMPHALLPLIGWRWIAGILPLVILYGASSNSQVRDFGIYYSMVTVPFLTLGSAFGALVVARALLARERGGPRRGGIGRVPRRRAGLRRSRGLQPASLEVRSGRDARRHREPGVRAGGPRAERAVSARGLRRTPRPADARDAERSEYGGAIALLAPALNAYPFEKGQLDALAQRAQPTPGSGGIVIVRRP